MHVDLIELLRTSQSFISIVFSICFIMIFFVYSDRIKNKFLLMLVYLILFLVLIRGGIFFKNFLFFDMDDHIPLVYIALELLIALFLMLFVIINRKKVPIYLMVILGLSFFVFIVSGIWVEGLFRFISGIVVLFFGYVVLMYSFFNKVKNTKIK